MSTSGPIEGVPFVGPAVTRGRLLRVLKNLAPKRILILAPAGYGKTYLCAQLIPEGSPHAVAWIDCSDQPVESDVLLRRVAGSLQAVRPSGSSDSLSTGDAAPLGDRPLDAPHMLGELMQAAATDGELLLVLDSLRLQHSLDAVEALAREVSRVDRARLVVTTREIPEDAYGVLSRFHFVEPDELRFDVSEIGELIALMGGEDDCPVVADAILDASTGQAALACVLAKHFVAKGDSSAWHIPANADITSLLIGLAQTQLRQEEMEILHVIALLGSASVGEIAALGRRADVQLLLKIAERIPLLRIRAGELAVDAQAQMHAVAQAVFASRRFTISLEFDDKTVFQQAVALLEQRGEYDRVIALLAGSPSGETGLADWLEHAGAHAAAAGARLAVREAIDSLPTASLLARPRLLLLGAQLDSDLSQSEQSLLKASAARDLARNSGDVQLETDACLLMAMVLTDQCRLEEALECMESVGSSAKALTSAEDRVKILSYLAAHAGLLLDLDKSAVAKREIASILETHRLSPAVNAMVLNRVSGLEMMFGDTHRSLSGYAEVMELSPVPIEARASAIANRATLLMEVGKLDRALELATEGASFSERYGLDSHQEACNCTVAATAYCGSASLNQLDVIERALERFVEWGDRASEDFARLYLAVMNRASRRMAAAMIHIDQVLEHSGGSGIEYFRLLAEIELAANTLALGDATAAGSRAAEVREQCAARRADYHLIRADMVLAEVARREGRLEEARSRLLDREEYILSENANWSIAMYIRAFPHLLGLFASALGSERLPVLMLRMITGHHVEDSLSAARKVLDESEWNVLAQRMLGEEGADRIAALATTAPCRVRLFGGLEVSVGTRQVPERDWRKRKARLLFAMLALQQGREVPREQIYDHLWPEMDGDRSRNNFYVIWSSMKGALVPGSSKGEACPYIEHTGGVCKIVSEHVHSDVAEFDLLMSSARQSESAGDGTAAVRYYEQVADLYRGELLPGDVYDDWFSAARNHYRHEFCDAMRSAHRLLTEMGDHPGALRMIRRGINADPWREDLYQAALRSHIAAGQRSAAIDTYLTCRANLADQLGLDPSAETLKLYEQVLAMEETPGTNA